MRPSSEYWSELYAMHSPSLREFVSTRVPAPEVDDLLQDVWASLARTLEDQDIEQPRAWIYRVARNRIADLYRRRGSQPVLQNVTDELAQPQESVDLSGEELGEEIQEALSLLPPNQREVFVRNELGGETLREIAEELGIPLKTVISRKGYARRRLQELLRETYEDYFGIS